MQYRVKFVRNTFYLLAIMAIAQFADVARARDSAQQHSIADAMNSATARSYSGVEFYFGDQSHAEPRRFIGTYTSKKTTNAFGKSDYEACQWAFLSAIKSFHRRALREGGNAVINLTSITTGQPFKSSDQFMCRAGNVVAKVYLQGDVVKLD